MLLDDSHSLRIGDLGMAGTIYHVEGIDRCAILGVNSRERYQDIVAIERTQYIIQQADAVRSLKLNQRVIRKGLVVDRDASGKLNSNRDATAQTLRFFDGWNKVEALVFECSAQSLLYKLEIARVRNWLRFRVAHAENTKDRIV